MTSAATTTPAALHKPCIFCSIANKKIPASIVYEDDDFVAFLDIHPIRPGHVLLVSREHHDYFDDMPPALAARFIQLGQRLSKAMKGIHGVERVSFLCTGTDIAHVHAHLVPLFASTDITSTAYIEQKGLSFAPAPLASDEELARQSALLQQALAAAHQLE
ncbi:HIT family protein [Pollutimonas harenae]|uniref:HIT family protein n=1 Tax=Pollutimonas harenae TaxID=657015 RepID=A0A853H1L1_9BURK|nr:HIT family protein [Pollutimonas harenae]NYT84044.1 HIT family protein [Pollutimonas harenae]TEA73531.1 HIT family protein [Pollutimonas harenae]